MRILVHDYSGHPFPVELSRELAWRGHEVVHLYSAANPTSPKGALTINAGDPSTLRISSIGLPRVVNKRAFLDRWRLERLYGARLAVEVRAINPEVLLLANTPLDAARKVLVATRELDLPVVYWLQDLIGEATARILRRKIGILGNVVGEYYKRVERRIMRSVDHIVGITEDFRPIVASARVDEACYSTIHNWSPLHEISPRAKENAWRRDQGLNGHFVFLYSGTLGFKHNPSLFLELARVFSSDRDVRIVINSQGSAADWLRGEAEKKGLSHLIVNPFQPYEHMSEVLSAGDVLLCILEPDAGVYSVPSKVLSYHCAGRPMVLAVPRENLAARIVENERSGIVVDPRDPTELVRAARDLYENEEARVAMGRRARSYAECTFAIDGITDRFERIFLSVLRLHARRD